MSVNGDLSGIFKNTVNNALRKQVKHPKTLLFSLSLIIIFVLLAILLKSNLEISLEAEKDLGKSFGNTANFFAGIIIIPFVLWIYLKDLIVYSLEKPIEKYNQFRLNRMRETGAEELKVSSAKKASSSFYFTIRRFLLNLHCIGCLLLCGFVILHMISLFEDHSGANFILPWIAISYGTYLSITGLIVRVKWWKKSPLMKKARRIARGIHTQVIIALIALIALNLHLASPD
ncbi:MAG: hypothetical protein ACW98F_08635 [Candidatus Hodarchaeales archaeon]